MPESFQLERIFVKLFLGMCVSTLVKDIRFIRKELKYTQLMMANLKDWISHLC